MSAVVVHAKHRLTAVHTTQDSRVRLALVCLAGPDAPCHLATDPNGVTIPDQHVPECRAAEQMADDIHGPAGLYDGTDGTPVRPFARVDVRIDTGAGPTWVWKYTGDHDAPGWPPPEPAEAGVAVPGTAACSAA